jgi:regulator of sigma E protease
MTFSTILIVIGVFCVLILSHEFGHFIAAKSCGVYVEDFSLGMGPRFLRFKGKETTYNLRVFPIGGWCKMRGEDEDCDDPRAFNKKKVWQRMLIIFAGPAMNFIFAFILFIIVFMMIGTASTANVVGEVAADSPAAAAGLSPGDVIIEINGTAIDEWADISSAINANGAGETVYLTVARDSQNIDMVINPYYSEDYQSWMIGITPEVTHQNVFTAIKLGFVQSVQFTVLLVQSLAQMITGAIPAEVAGPVGIVTIIGQATSYGLQSLIILTAYLSINLGLINLFPLPALDGSRLVFLVIEKLRGKPMDQRKEGMVHFVGLIMLFGLMIVITYQDIMRLITGS